MKQKAVSILIDPRDLPQTSGIYKIYFNDPTLFYVGSAVDLRRRYRRHLNDLRKGTHTNPHLLNAFKQYGEDAMCFEVIEHIEEREDLVAREQQYLDAKPHYNICNVAFTPPRYSPSPELRERLRAASKSRTERLGKRFVKGQAAHNKGVPMSEDAKGKSRVSHLGQQAWNKGKSCSNETREKLRTSHLGQEAWNKGVPMPEEQKIAHSKRMKGKSLVNGGTFKKGQETWNKGIPMSDASKQKLSEAKKGRVPWNKGLKRAQ